MLHVLRRVSPVVRSLISRCQSPSEREKVAEVTIVRYTTLSSENLSCTSCRSFWEGEGEGAEVSRDVHKRAGCCEEVLRVTHIA